MPNDERAGGRGLLRVEDPRDRKFSFSTLGVRATTLRKRDWFADGWWGDQGYTPQCVAYAWLHWLNDGPVLYSALPSRRPGHDPNDVYCTAQTYDPWPGDCTNPQYDGTALRSGAKVIQERGHIANYYWANTVDEIVTALLELGPVVMGTNWYTGMDLPDFQGYVRPTGSYGGGHAYLLNGVDLDKGWVRIKNSWGRNWGKGGHAYLTLADLGFLMNAYGEACVPTQELP
jgi:hypothetical protein